MIESNPLKFRFLVCELTVAESSICPLQITKEIMS